MRNLFKLFAILSLMISSLFAGNVSSSNVSEYSVTIKKLEIFNTTTNTWITIADTAKTVNIASTATAGADIASMASKETAITYGTYTKLRTTISNQFSIKACNNAGNECTDGTTTSSYGGSHTVADATAANMASATSTVNTIDFSVVTIPNAIESGGDLVITYDLTSPFVINQTVTSAPSISVKFNVNNVLQYDSAPTPSVIYVQAPGVTVTLN